jgi:hypothetical protein
MNDQSTRFGLSFDPIETHRQRFFVGDGEDGESVLLQFGSLIVVDFPVPRRNHDVRIEGITYCDVFDHFAFPAFDGGMDENPLT